jgi:hypothetical protein
MPVEIPVEHVLYQETINKLNLINPKRLVVTEYDDNRGTIAAIEYVLDKKQVDLFVSIISK